MSAAINEMLAVAPLPLDRLRPSPTNPRRRFDRAAMDELTESVRQHGIFQPILVRPIDAEDFEIVAGERRFRAAKAVGLGSIPAIVRPLQDQEAIELQVLENLQREDLDPLEEADGYDALVKRGIHTVDSLAARVGKSRSYVYQRLTLARLCPKGRKAMDEGKFSPSVALLVARMPETALQDRACEKLLDSLKQYGRAPDATVSLHEAQRIVHENFMLRLAAAPFNTKDADLKPGAGSCTSCPKRAGAAPELFPDITKADTCSDPDCYADKVRLDGIQVAEAARANGQKVIEGKAAKKLKPLHSSEIQGLTPLEAPIHDVPGHKTVKQLLGSDFKPTIFVDPHNGQAIATAPNTAIADALERAGIEKTPRSSKSPEERARERKHRIETAYRQALLTELRTPREYDTADALFVAVAMIERLDSDNRKRLFKLRNWVGHQGEAGLAELIAREVAPAALPQLMIDAALIGETYVSTWALDSKPTRMLELAERLGVDADAVWRQAMSRVTDEEQAKRRPGRPKREQATAKGSGE